MDRELGWNSKDEKVRINEELGYRVRMNEELGW